MCLRCRRECLPKRARTITSDFPNLWTHRETSRLIAYGEDRIVDYMRKNRLFVHASAIWKHDLKLCVYSQLLSPRVRRMGLASPILEMERVHLAHPCEYKNLYGGLNGCAIHSSARNFFLRFDKDDRRQLHGCFTLFGRCTLSKTIGNPFAKAARRVRLRVLQCMQNSRACSLV